jgi:F-type H+-transporting ATPase subunit delta
MSFSKKIVTTYSKSLFQTIISVQKSKQKQSINAEETFEKSKLFDLSKILSLTEEQNEDSITVLSIGEELSLLSSFLTASKAIQIFFNNPTVPELQKLNILLKSFPGLTRITKAFLKVLKEKSHLGLIPEIQIEYNEYLLRFQNSTKIHLITATVLEENYGLLLLETLKKITNSKDIILTVSYNPQLLGGFILEYNSTSTDATILKEFSLFFTE